MVLIFTCKSSMIFMKNSLRIIYRNLISISLFLCIIGIMGCQEGVITPTTPPPPPPNLSTALTNLWVPVSVKLGQQKFTDLYNGMRLSFYENGQFTFHSPLQNSSGEWTLKDSTLVMVGSETTVAKLLELSTTKFRYIVEMSGSIGIPKGTVFEYEKVPDGTIFSLNGSMDNDQGLSLPSKLYVSLLWERVESPNTFIVWGQGQISNENNTYSIRLDEYPSVLGNCLNYELLQCNLGIGYYGAARIVLHSDPTLKDGTVINDISSWILMGNFWGAVNDRHIVFVSNDTQEFLNTSVKFPAHYNVGYDIGKKKTFPGETSDRIAPLNLNERNRIVLQVNQNWNDFTFAQWRPQ